MARKPKPEPKPIKAKEPKPVSKAQDSTYWDEVVQAMATKKTAPRRPRGE